MIEQETLYREHGIALFSGLHPLAIDDMIFMRTATNVLAVDFHTGKRIWQTNDEEGSRGSGDPNRFNRAFIGAEQHEPAGPVRPADLG